MPLWAIRSDKFRFRSELIRFTRIPDHNTVTSVARESVPELLRIPGPSYSSYTTTSCSTSSSRNGRPALPRPWLPPLHIGMRRFSCSSADTSASNLPSEGSSACSARCSSSIYLCLSARSHSPSGGKFFTMRSSPDYFVSATPFWFMRTYLCLYLISPVINLFLSHSNTKQRLALLCVLAFISHYLGSAGFDPSLAGGKNLVTFLFLLRCGRHPVPLPQPLATLHRTCGRCWCGLNIGLVLLFTFWTSRTANALYSRVWFSLLQLRTPRQCPALFRMDRWPALPFAAHQPHRPLVACHLPDPRGTVCRAPRHRTVRAAFHLSPSPPQPAARCRAPDDPGHRSGMCGHRPPAQPRVAPHRLPSACASRPAGTV